MIVVTWVLSAGVTWGIYSERINNLKRERESDLRRIEDLEETMLSKDEYEHRHEEHERRHTEILRLIEHLRDK